MNRPSEEGGTESSPGRMPGFFVPAGHGVPPADEARIEVRTELGVCPGVGQAERHAQPGAARGTEIVVQSGLESEHVGGAAVVQIAVSGSPGRKRVGPQQILVVVEVGRRLEAHRAGVAPVAELVVHAALGFGLDLRAGSGRGEPAVDAGEHVGVPVDREVDPEPGDPLPNVVGPERQRGSAAVGVRHAEVPAREIDRLEANPRRERPAPRLDRIARTEMS